MAFSKNDVMTVTEASKELAVDPAHVRLLIRRGTLKAENHGTLWLLPVAEVERYKRERKPVGRPAKKASKK
jgi:excisionase family DNA binding protein